MAPKPVRELALSCLHEILRILSCGCDARRIRWFKKMGPVYCKCHRKYKMIAILKWTRGKDPEWSLSFQGENTEFRFETAVPLDESLMVSSPSALRTLVIEGGKHR